MFFCQLSTPTQPLEEGKCYAQRPDNIITAMVAILHLLDCLCIRNIALTPRTVHPRKYICRELVQVGGNTGSICHFAFSPVLQCLGVSRYRHAGKNSTKSVIVTPLFCVPQMLVN